MCRLLETVARFSATVSSTSTKFGEKLHWYCATILAEFHDHRALNDGEQGGDLS
jgi:hypothetical protein